MKTVVFAYHDMGIVGLSALKRAGFEIVALFSHGDDPKENCWFDSVRDWAANENVSLYCPTNVNEPEWVQRISTWKPDIMFSFYYRALLGKELLSIPPDGSFNLHGSFLPAYRGRCPVNWVLVNGEVQTGVTLHRMVLQPDAGDIVAQQAVLIDFGDTALSLYRKLCHQASIMLDEVLPRLQEGTAEYRKQDLDAGSYYGGRTPADGRIDWQWSAQRIYNLIRAVTEPYPGAFTVTSRGEKMTIWWALPETGGHDLEAGAIEQDRGAVFVFAGERGRIRLLDIEIQGQRMKGEAIGRYFSEKERIVLQ